MVNTLIELRESISSDIMNNHHVTDHRTTINQHIQIIVRRENLNKDSYVHEWIIVPIKI